MSQAKSILTVREQQTQFNKPKSLFLLNEFYNVSKMCL